MRRVRLVVGSGGVLRHATRGDASAALGAVLADHAELLIEGRTNREIAAELGVDEDAVARRLAEMYAKIGVSSRGEAAAFAFREGVV